MLRLACPAVLLVVLFFPPGARAAAVPDADFRTRLESVLKQVARYDFGGDRAAAIALAELSKATRGQPAQRRELGDRLAALLAANIPPGAKDLACRQLAVIGAAEHVPALARLLVDEKLAHMARYALERIAGPACDEALCQALERTKGKQLIGVMRSIGVRRDASAVDALASRLADSDREVAAAAAWSLGQIATPAAIKALSGALNTTQGRACPAIGEACLFCAERLAADGDRDQAAALYDRLRSSDVPASVRRAAMRGAILLRQSAELLVEQLRAGDDEMFNLALGLVREMAEHKIVVPVAAELARLSAPRQVRLIRALADRGDKAAGPAVFALARQGDLKVRAAAIGAMARLGDPSVGPFLIQVATGENSELAAAARSTLVAMPDNGVGLLMLKSLGDASPKVRRLGAEVLGQQQTPGDVDGLFRAAADPDQAVRLAAIKSLGTTATLPDPGRLAALVVKASGPAERAAAEGTCAAACAGRRDKDACADKLLALMPGADKEARSALLRTLSQIGGRKALRSVCAAMQESDPEIQDVVVRALSNWTTAEPLDQLAAIAKDSPNRKHKLLALRGYVRLVGLSDAGPDRKLAMCDKAMHLADRDEERRLVLGALGALSTPQAMDRALTHLGQPGLNSEAASAAIAVARKLVRADPDAVARAMTRVVAQAKSPAVKKRAEELLNRAKGKSRG